MNEHDKLVIVLIFFIKCHIFCFNFKYLMVELEGTTGCRQRKFSHALVHTTVNRSIQFHR